MTSAPSTPSEPKDQNQDPTEQALEVVKQFLALGIGGIGFVSGIAFTEARPIGPIVYWILTVPFAMAVMFGLVFLMAVAGEMAKGSFRGVGSKRLRVLAIAQIGSFVIGLAAVATTTSAVILAAPHGPPPEPHAVRMFTSDGEFIEFPIPLGVSVEIRLSNTSTLPIMPTPSRLPASDEFSRSLVGLVVSEAQQAGFGIAAPCAGHLVQFIEAGLADIAATAPAALINRRREIEAAARNFSHAMIEEARIAGQTELHEPSFFAAKERLCPLWPFC